MPEGWFENGWGHTRWDGLIVEDSNKVRFVERAGNIDFVVVEGTRWTCKLLLGLEISFRKISFQTRGMMMMVIFSQ